MATVMHWTPFLLTMGKRLFLTGLLFYQTLTRPFHHLSTKLFFQRRGECERSVLNRRRDGLLVLRTGLQVGSAPCKGIQDSLGFWIPRCRFRISGSGFQTLSLEFGFRISIVIGIRIPWAVFQIPKAKIPDSTSKRFPYSGIPCMRW